MYVQGTYCLYYERYPPSAIFYIFAVLISRRLHGYTSAAQKVSGIRMHTNIEALRSTLYSNVSGVKRNFHSPLYGILYGRNFES